MSKKISSKSPVSGDTIVAIITPPGEGGIAAIRIAGKYSLSVLATHFKPQADYKTTDFKPFLMRFGHFIDKQDNKIDEILAVYMPKNNSYTGEEQVEIFCHGGVQTAKMILGCLVDSGCRAAEPGEFTKLAFLSGRIDLSKAEAVAEILAGRPFATPSELHAVIGPRLSEADQRTVYGAMFIPVGLNSGAEQDYALIPSSLSPRKLAHEFEEYRPYESIDQFRREMSKYVSDAEVEYLTRFVTLD